MKQAICTLKSASPYGQGKFHQTPKLKGELHADYEERVWREKLHYDEKTEQVFIPGSVFASSLREAAKYRSDQIPGKGKSTFTKHFDSGIIVTDNLNVGFKKSQIKAVPVLVPSDGKVGGGSRVIKYFPVIPEWSGKVTFTILDDIITPEIFEQTIRTSGRLIGIGVWRPRNRGMWGRFELVDMKWDLID